MYEIPNERVCSVLSVCDELLSLIAARFELLAFASSWARAPGPAKARAKSTTLDRASLSTQALLLSQSLSSSHNSNVMTLLCTGRLRARPPLNQTRLPEPGRVSGRGGAGGRAEGCRRAGARAGTRMACSHETPERITKQPLVVPQRGDRIQRTPYQNTTLHPSQPPPLLVPFLPSQHTAPRSSRPARTLTPAPNPSPPTPPPPPTHHTNMSPLSSLLPSSSSSTPSSTPLGTLHIYDIHHPGAHRALRILATAALAKRAITLAPNYTHGETNLTPEFRAKWPTGQVPAFETAEGAYISEGSAIALYVALSAPEAGLLGEGIVGQALVAQWQGFVDFSILNNL